MGGHQNEPYRNTEEERGLDSPDYLIPNTFLYKVYTRVYPKVSGLAAWRENCKCYRSLPLYRYFVSQYSEFCRHNPLCGFSTGVYCCKGIFRYRLSPETFGHTLLIDSHHGMACPQERDDLQIREVPTNILNRQSQTADKGWYVSLS
jgi:hypothetical protein